MLKRTIAAGIAFAVVAAAGACRQEPETAAIDTSVTTMPDTARLGIPDATIGTDTIPGTQPADTLGTYTPPPTP